MEDGVVEEGDGVVGGVGGGGGGGEAFAGPGAGGAGGDGRGEGGDFGGFVGGVGGLEDEFAGGEVEFAGEGASPAIANPRRSFSGRGVAGGDGIPTADVEGVDYVG